jgi:hypothetical protein
MDGWEFRRGGRLEKNSTKGEGRMAMAKIWREGKIERNWGRRGRRGRRKRQKEEAKRMGNDYGKSPVRLQLDKSPAPAANASSSPSSFLGKRSKKFLDEKEIWLDAGGLLPRLCGGQKAIERNKKGRIKGREAN